MEKTLYVLSDRTGESMSCIVCDVHARMMPPVDGDRVLASWADSDIACEFCPHNDDTLETR